ncbi:hypothetical protein BC938DRAFT_480132 [Jimgerdemannia flammicorona]|uniref:WWE domain-containing protein n=1 Tax=Jimgerdemannia flammicorona TaxID=994334 RepID=A0A433QJB4_9FUNG|nr:hypothetical protein BC938DRAFT_480132 [Jimgerdemannia flammicorona]
MSYCVFKRVFEFGFRIPYDKAASTEIETAFQNPQQNKMTLTQGYFATHPGESEVLFDRAARSFVQVNTGSGRRRAVRRLANDDNSVLIRVPRATIGTDHNICAICQNRLDETSLLLDSGEASSGNSGDSSPNEKSPGSHQHQEGSLHESVRLPQCAPGHYFHRVCVAQAIKLKDQCP